MKRICFFLGLALLVASPINNWCWSTAAASTRRFLPASIGASRTWSWTIWSASRSFAAPGLLWGANAVNGVINIITRNAADTQGMWVRFGGGSEERVAASARYGGRRGDNLYYRIYGKVFERDAFVDSTGIGAADGWQVGRGGFRLDWESTENNSLSLQAAIYRGEAGQTYTLISSPQPPYEETFDTDTQFFSGHLLGRWQRTFSPQSDLSLQVYYFVLKDGMHNAAQALIGFAVATGGQYAGDERAVEIVVKLIAQGGAGVGKGDTVDALAVILQSADQADKITVTTAQQNIVEVLGL